MPAPQSAPDSLYAGPDLQRAAELSPLRRTPGDRFRGVRNAAAILGDLAKKRLEARATANCELVVATGPDPLTGDELRAAYIGAGENRAWCLSSVFDRHEVTARRSAVDPADIPRLVADMRDDVDVLFIEGILGRSFARSFDESGPPFAGMPAWIKQRVRLHGDWPRQVAGLKRDTRQETARILRKYQYGCSLTRRPEDHADFYDRLYLPYVTGRFGPAAHVVERRRFLTECRRGVLLRLAREGHLLGAALLRPVGRTMAVVWSALHPEKESADLRGATDALDYFSLLYAHLQRCRWLDLGPSRPDLCDGTLRYKAKWGSEIYRGLVSQSGVTWRCNEKRAGGLGFLRRHVFLIRVAGGLRAVAVVDGGADASASKLGAMLNPGVRDYRVVALSPPGERLAAAARDFGGHMTVVEAKDYRDVMSAITAA
jgi:hypothetical protein